MKCCAESIRHISTSVILRTNTYFECTRYKCIVTYRWVAASFEDGNEGTSLIDINYLNVVALLCLNLSVSIKLINAAPVFYHYLTVKSLDYCHWPYFLLFLHFRPYYLTWIEIKFADLKSGHTKRNITL